MKHWRRGHKVHCRAISALKELNGIMNDMSDSSTQKSFHTSMDMVATIESFQDAESLDEPWVSKIRKSASPLQENVASGPSLLSLDSATAMRNLDYSIYRYRMQSHRRRCHPRKSSSPKKGDRENSFVDIFVEHLSRLCTYNIRMCIPATLVKSNSSFSKENVWVVLQGYDAKTQVNVLTLSEGTCYDPDRLNPIATFLLPAQFTCSKALNEVVTSSVNIRFVDSTQLEITFRIKYNESTCQKTPSKENIKTKENLKATLEALNRLECRSCGLNIIRTSTDSENPSPLRKILPLPEGYWDEITDYISCFETVSFV